MLNNNNIKKINTYSEKLRSLNVKSEAFKTRYYKKTTHTKMEVQHT